MFNVIYILLIITTTCTLVIKARPDFGQFDIPDLQQKYDDHAVEVQTTVDIFPYANRLTDSKMLKVLQDTTFNAPTELNPQNRKRSAKCKFIPFPR